MIIHLLISTNIVPPIQIQISIHITGTTTGEKFLSVVQTMTKVATDL